VDQILEATDYTTYILPAFSQCLLQVLLGQSASNAGHDIHEECHREKYLEQIHRKLHANPEAEREDVFEEQSKFKAKTFLLQFHQLEENEVQPDVREGKQAEHVEELTDHLAPGGVLSHNLTHKPPDDCTEQWPFEIPDDPRITRRSHNESIITSCLQQW